MISINRAAPNYSQNRIDTLLNFNTPQTWLVTNGNGSAIIDSSLNFSGESCLKLTNNSPNSLITFTNSDQNTIIKNSGTYSFGFYLRKSIKNYQINGNVKLFKDEVLIDTQVFSIGSDVSENDVSDEWVRYISTQKYSFNADDEISFVFEINEDLTATVLEVSLYVDGMMLYQKERMQQAPPIFNYTNTIENRGGWVYLQDDNSEGSQTINTTPTKLTVNELGSANDVLDQPDGIPIWDKLTNRLTPTILRDNFILTIDFSVVSRTNNPHYIIVTIDIGSDEDNITLPIRSRRIEINRAAPFDQGVTISIFCKDLFVGNKGRIFFHTDSGECQINNKGLHIVRVFKGS